MSVLPRDWDHLDRILTDWAMYERWGLTSGYGPGSGRGYGCADDAQSQWGRLRVDKALDGMSDSKARRVALCAYTDTPAWLRLPIIVELRGILLVMIEETPFRVYEMSGPPEPEMVEA